MNLILNNKVLQNEAASHNSPRTTLRNLGHSPRVLRKSAKSQKDECVLRSTASKVKLVSRNNASNQATSLATNSILPTPYSSQIAIHTSTSGTSTILPPIGNTGIIGNFINNIDRTENVLPISTKSRIEINKINQQRILEKEEKKE